MVKFITREEAAALVKDNDIVLTEGFLRAAFPEQLSKALGDRFEKTGSPKNLTLIYSAGQGFGKGTGVDHFGKKGLLKRVIAGHYNLAPSIQQLVYSNDIEAYNFPQGTISQLYRDSAGGRVGTLTHVGLKTFVDPRQDGGKLNSATTENLIELMNISGTELLLYKALRGDICFLRGSYADEKGNISVELEGVTLNTTSIAQLVKRSGGKVVVQVSNVVQAGTLNAQFVRLPHIYVDYVVVVPIEEQTADYDPNMIPVFAGSKKIPTGSIPPLPMDERKIIGRRGAMFLEPGKVVNLGIGMPETISIVANEEGIGDHMTLTVEAGPVGGVPQGGALFGVSINPDCIIDQAYQFDFYDGGGLDLAYLGLAECDEAGNINVSKMSGRLPGTGGFVNITQNAKKVFFCGTFTAKGLTIKSGDGKLTIVQEGSVKKFLKKVNHITFSGEYAKQVGQPVFYLTERAVFELKADGMHLTEVAPGIDIEKDILAHMEFTPIIKDTPKIMDARIFTDAIMGME